MGDEWENPTGGGPVNFKGRDVVNALFALDIGARVRRTSNQSIPTSAFTAIIFDLAGVYYDTDAMWSAVNPTQLAIQTPGKYCAKGDANFDSSALGSRILGIRINGGNFIALDSDPAVTSALIGTALNPSTEFDFVAGDYIELVAWQNTGVALDILSTADYSPVLTARKVDRAG